MYTKYAYMRNLRYFPHVRRRYLFYCAFTPRLRTSDSNDVNKMNRMMCQFLMKEDIKTIWS